MRSPPLVTIPHYSIPGICWGGGLIHYQPAAGDGKQRPLLRRSRRSPRLSRNVRQATLSKVLIHTFTHSHTALFPLQGTHMASSICWCNWRAYVSHDHLQRSSSVNRKRHGRGKQLVALPRRFTRDNRLGTQTPGRVS